MGQAPEEIAAAASAATTAGVVLGGAMWTGDLLTGYTHLEVGAEPVSVGKLMRNNPVRAELRYQACKYSSSTPSNYGVEG